ncbi:hypothetical protein FQY83_04010 [Luteimonas marina]|uniref:Uncharacterized protein n=1 Tax=Luteimonas marina TaxID=488485 RepID=A0A5C5UDC2_9GAMM|nr:hypothetical protein [Luteimonas marina]TWT23787.1 hypothetical protein FQY83_04010 [Luteimonas marina]
MASAESPREAPATGGDGEAMLSVLEALRRDASRAPGHGRRAVDAPDPALWSAFGSAATDQQRINLSLRLPGETRDRFFNAGHVLAASQPRDAAGDAMPPEIVRRLSPLARAFLESAESLVRRHRTRLYLGPGSAPAASRENHVVLDWKRTSGHAGPAAETITIDDFLSGRWNGLRLAGDPRYTLAAQSTMAACANLRALVETLRPRCERLAISIRTFDPA